MLSMVPVGVPAATGLVSVSNPPTPENIKPERVVVMAPVEYVVPDPELLVLVPSMGLDAARPLHSAAMILRQVAC